MPNIQTGQQKTNSHYSDTNKLRDDFKAALNEAQAGKKHQDYNEKLRADRIKKDVEELYSLYEYRAKNKLEDLTDRETELKASIKKIQYPESSKSVTAGFQQVFAGIEFLNKKRSISEIEKAISDNLELGFVDYASSIVHSLMRTENANAEHIELKDKVSKLYDKFHAGTNLKEKKAELSDLAKAIRSAKDLQSDLANRVNFNPANWREWQETLKRHSDATL